MPTYDEIMERIRSEMPEALAENSKYKSKLTFAARCSALAALKAGFNASVVAVAFGVNRSTVRFLQNPHSPHYKNVRTEYSELGHVRFISQYLTPDVLEMLNEARKRPEAQQSGTKARAASSVDTTSPNPRATSREGRHTIWYGAGTINVEVKWFDNVDEPGWYVYVDPASPGYEAGGWADVPMPVGEPEHRFTSKTTLDALLSALDGELK